jgi:hypothetical protein
MMKPAFKRVASWFKRSNSAKSTSAGSEQPHNSEKSAAQTPIDTSIGTFESEKQYNGSASSDSSSKLQSNSDDGYKSATIIAAPAAIHSPTIARRPVSSANKSQQYATLQGYTITERDGRSELTFLSWPNSSPDIKLPTPLPAVTAVPDEDQVVNQRSATLAGNPELSFLSWPNAAPRASQ